MGGRLDYLQESVIEDGTLSYTTEGIVFDAGALAKVYRGSIAQLAKNLGAAIYQTATTQFCPLCTRFFWPRFLPSVCAPSFLPLDNCILVTLSDSPQSHPSLCLLLSLCDICWV